MTKYKLPKNIKDAIKISVEKDILPSLEQNIGDYVAHYIGKMDVDFENEKDLVKKENAVTEAIWKELMKKFPKK
jgi:hypothetical protein